MSNVSTTASKVMALFAKHLDKRSEKVLFKTPVLYELGVKRPLPGKAGTIMFVPKRYSRNNVRLLAEGTVLDHLSSTSAWYYSGAVSGYGDVRKYSDFLVKVMEVPDQISQDVADMSKYLGYKYDTLIRNKLSGAGTFVSPDGTTAAGSVQSATNLKQRFLFDAATTLANLDAYPYSDNLFAAVLPPIGIHDLFVSTSGGSQLATVPRGSGFLDNTESGAQKLERMTIGMLGQCRVMSSTQSSRYITDASGGMCDSTASCGYQALVLAPGAFAVVDLETARPKTYIKPFGQSGHLDTLDQLMSVGVKGYFVPIAMDTTNRLVRTAIGKNL